jgi:hypothetical protein
MTPKDKRKAATERKRLERQRKRELGMLPLEVWVHWKNAPVVKDFVAELNGEKKCQ